jgi:hypothetical protein
MGILLGATLAFLRPALNARIGPRTADVLAAVGTALLAYGWTHVEGTNPILYRGGFLVAELASLAVIFAASYPRTTCTQQLLSATPLRWAGMLSYGIYLWHWPVFCVLSMERVHGSELVVTALRLATTLAIAVASYFGLERPIRLRGLPVRYPHAVAIAAFGLAFATAAACIRPGPAQPTEALAHGGRDATAALLLANRETRGRLSPYALSMAELPTTAQLVPGTLRILTLGDSVAQKLGFALRVHQDTVDAFVADRGVGDCSIMESLHVKSGEPLGHPNPHAGCAANWVRDVKLLKPDITFVILGGAYLANIVVDGQPQTACGAGWQTAYSARLNQLLDEMGGDAGAVSLALVPYPGPRWVHGTVIRDVDCFNQLLTRIAKQRQLNTVDLFAQLCAADQPRGTCQLLSEGAPIRPDGLHPECPGAAAIARWTLRQLRDEFINTHAAGTEQRNALDASPGSSDRSLPQNESVPRPSPL